MVEETIPTSKLRSLSYGKMLGCRVIWLSDFSLRVADTVHIGLNAHNLYFSLVSNCGNIYTLAGLPRSGLAQMYVAATSDFIIRLIYSGRIYLFLKEQKVLACSLLAIITLFSVGSTAIAFALASLGFTLTTYLEFHRLSWALYSGLAACVAADFFIAVSLSTLLIQCRTGFHRMDSTISFLVALAINTGLVTSICALGRLIAYALLPDSLIYFGVYILLTKLYFNALLASLNSRGMAQSRSIATTGITRPEFFKMKETSDVASLP
ncbi:hypothetical protein NLJ89_g5992 [Agrocybe chaxingu]|uniref:DUF6534 domain-containing protein n=1 Tax=Agrocybe chaxingu TaxID=84603 RepID=A0A9W8MWG1_9AGAR|nr:hypothetical protein NLJ89_g5992 [Agrocybe chaxingu]